MRKSSFPETKWFLSIILMFFISSPSLAQFDYEGSAYCGVSPSFFASLKNGTGGTMTLQGNLTAPTSFPSTAVITCGKFKLYYKDLMSGVGGFADGTYGAQRCSTLCAVLTYVQSVFDFSSIPSNQYIRFYIDNSYSDNVSYYAPCGTSWLAQAGPYYKDNASGTTNGYVYEYATTGSDPALYPDDYHAYLKVNFHATYPVGSCIPDYLYYQNDGTTSVLNCQYDLYTVLLHEVGHTLGFISFIQYNYIGPNLWGAANLTPAVTNYNIFTGHDYSMYVGDNDDVFPTLNLTKLITPPLSNPTLNNTVTTAQANRLWSNNQGAPYNYPLFSGDNYTANGFVQSIMNSYGSHLDREFFSYSARERVSPGNRRNVVMSPRAFKGQERRIFSKGEIENFQNFGDGAMGWNLTTSFASANASLLANHVPFSTRMAGLGYTNYSIDKDFAENVAADLPQLVNNTGSFVDINLWQDATLVDADNDVITIASNSVVNFRGAGENGNTHTNTLTILNNGQTLRFTPRAGFFGRAQFGFELWDGKEKGSFVLYTVDVVPGTNVPYSIGNNMVVNGDFEEGSEVKVLTTYENVPNAMLDHDCEEGRFNRATHFSDGHPYSYRSNWQTFGGGLLIKNSHYQCYDATQKSRVGYASGNFPDINVNALHPNALSGNRYLKMFAQNDFSYFNLKTNTQNCTRYILEYDIHSTQNASTSVEVGFDHSSSLTAPPLNQNFGYIPSLNFTTTANAIVTPATWQHVSNGFWYCGNSSNLLYLKNNTQWNGNMFSNRIFIDNVSLVVDQNPPPMTVDITASGACGNIMTAQVQEAGCNPVYQWTVNGNPFGGNTSSITIPSTQNASVAVTVTTACGQTANDTYNFSTTTNGTCHVCTIWQSTTATELGSGGTISSDPSAGNYYIDNDVAISGTVNFNNCIVFVGPDVTITVGNGSKIVINHSHFFGCTQMWDGILLTGDGKFSAVNNSLIEDAVTAVSVSAPTLTGSDPTIYTNDAIFNRNYRAINIFDANNAALSSFFVIRNTIFTSRLLSSYPYNSWPTNTTLKASSTFGVYEANYALRNYTSADCKSSAVPNDAINITISGSYTGTYTNPVYSEIVVGEAATGTGSSSFNVFDNLTNGIRTLNSNLTSLNNVFMLMRGTDVNGSGILAMSGSLVLNPQYRTRAYNGTGDQSNKFYDCTNAAYVIGYKDVTMQRCSVLSNHTIGNTYGSGKYGFNIQGAAHFNYSIKENKMYNLETAIYINALTSTNQQALGATDVSTNSIGSNIPGNTETTRWLGRAITIENLNPCVTCPYTGQTNVNNNTIIKVYNGIKIDGFAQEGYVKENTITLKNDNTIGLQYGIWHTDCKNDHVYINTVTGFGYTDYAKRAYYSEGNENIAVKCNFATENGRGFDFIGNSGIIRWMGNTMTNNGYSFAVQGAIGTQGINNKKPSDNKWLTQSGFTYAVPARPQTITVQNSNPWLSYLWVHNNTAENPTHNYSQPQNNTFEYAVGNGMGITSFNTPLTCPTPPMKKAVAGSSYGLIQGQTNLGVYNVTARFIAQYNHWQSLLVDSNIVDEDTTGLIDDFRVLGHDSRFALLARVDSLIAYDELSAAQTLANSSAMLTPLPCSTALGSLIYDGSDVDPVIENHIKYYNLYFAYRDSSFNTDDSLQLDSLANLCFMIEGNAVLQSRVLYHIIYDNSRIFPNDCPAMFEDEEEHEERGSQQGMNPLASTTRDGHGYNLLPNPNSGNFIIQQLTSDDRPVNVEVWNAIGARIYKADHRFRSKRTEIKLGTVSPGNYLLKLIDRNGEQFTIKFTVL